MHVSFGARIAGALHAAMPRLGPMLARLEPKTLCDEVALLRGDEAQAAAFHEQALKLDPTFPLAMRRLGDMLFDQRDFTDALVQYKRAIEKNPRDFRAQIQAGLAARYTNDATTALDYFVRSGKASREGWQAFYNEACLHAAEKRPMEVLQRLRDAIEREPNVASLARDDRDFDPLRMMLEFATLLASVEGPGNRRASPLKRAAIAGK